MHQAPRMIYLVLGLLCFVYWLILGLSVRFGQSLSWIWIAAGTVLLLCAFSFRLHLPDGLRIAWRSLLGLGLAALIVLEIPVISQMNAELPEGLDAVIVLGAKVNSGSMDYRVRTAADYLRKNPRTVAILSGGWGEDEEMSEAEAMRRQMTALGIDESRLILEDRSTSTAENFRFSKELLPAGTASVGVVTSCYHVHRALLLAKREGYENVYGGAAPNVPATLPHYTVREAIGLVMEKLRGNL